MKTISCKEISKTPVSLSKAASILSKFVSTDNGASHVVDAYLRRSSAAFTELVLLHKELKSNRKHKKKPKSEEADRHQQLEQERVELLSEEKLSHEVKGKKRRKINAGELKIEEVKASRGSDVSRDPSYDTKNDYLMNDGSRIGKFEGKVKEEVVSEKERHGDNKKKSKDRNKIEISNFEKEEKQKKRKSGEVDKKNENNSEEQRRKKKIKSERDG